MTQVGNNVRIDFQCAAIEIHYHEGVDLHFLDHDTGAEFYIDWVDTKPSDRRKLVCLLDKVLTKRFNFSVITFQPTCNSSNCISCLKSLTHILTPLVTQTWLRQLALHSLPSQETSRHSASTLCGLGQTRVESKGLALSKTSPTSMSQGDMLPDSQIKA